jgi:hypothetical protein
MKTCFPTTIVDNFFENPSLIRKFALGLQYHKLDSVPGVRTKRLEEIEPEFSIFLHKKILSIFFDLNKENISYDMSTAFQLTSKKYEEGWVHIDDVNTFAAVVYLNPETDPSAGTSVHKQIRDCNVDVWDQRNMFYNDTVDVESIRKIREEHNSKFSKTLDVCNVYNRLFLYDGQSWHKENKFFGETADDSRLTLVIFGDVYMNKMTQFPIDRVRSFATY